MRSGGSSRTGWRPTNTPATFWFVDELPKGPTGKILKREISTPAVPARAMARH